MSLRKIEIRGFTVLEIILAVLALAIVSAFAIPSYNKSRDKTLERDIIFQLKLIHSAQNDYFRTHNEYMSTTNDINTINTKLNLNIISQGEDYSCTGNSTSWDCIVTASSADPVFKIKIESTTPIALRYKPDTTQGNPWCVNGVCPSLGP